jgi:hypothetical protein
LQRSGREEAGPRVQASPGPRINLPAGEIFSARGLKAEPAGSRGGRDKQGRDGGNRDRGLIGVSPKHRWQVSTSAAEAKDFSSPRDGRSLRGQNDDKIRIWSEPSHCRLRRRQWCESARLRLPGIHAAENSDQQARVIAEIEQDGGADGQVATETDARQPARFTAAGILAAAKKFVDADPSG